MTHLTEVLKLAQAGGADPEVVQDYISRYRGLTIIGTKTYAKGQSSSSGPRSGRIPPRATCSASKNA
jgi:hypothetical protein